MAGLNPSAPYSTEKPGYPTTQSGYSTGLSGYSNAPAGYSSAPQGYGSAPAGYGNAPEFGYSTAYHYHGYRYQPQQNPVTEDYPATPPPSYELQEIIHTNFPATLLNVNPIVTVQPAPQTATYGDVLAHYEDAVRSSIAATFCCIPLGLLALLNATHAKAEFQANNIVQAKSHLRSSRRLGMAGLFIGSITVALVIIFLILRL